MRKSEGETRIPKSLRDRIRRVKLVVFDADGVLTDGTIYLLPDGRELKAFNALDGTGMKYLERAGIATAVLSGRRSAAVNHRAREVGTRYVLQGYKRKLAGLAKLARVSKRSVARWEAKTGQPASPPVDGWICDAFESVGVEFVATPTLGARLAEQAG